MNRYFPFLVGPRWILRFSSRLTSASERITDRPIVWTGTIPSSLINCWTRLVDVPSLAAIAVVVAIQFVTLYLHFRDYLARSRDCVDVAFLNVVGINFREVNLRTGRASAFVARAVRVAVNSAFGNSRYVEVLAKPGFDHCVEEAPRNYLLIVAGKVGVGGPSPLFIKRNVGSEFLFPALCGAFDCFLYSLVHGLYLLQGVCFEQEDTTLQTKYLSTQFFRLRRNILCTVGSEAGAAS